MTTDKSTKIQLTTDICPGFNRQPRYLNDKEADKEEEDIAAIALVSRSVWVTNTHPFLPLRYAYTVDICVDLLDLLDTRNFVQSLHYQGNEPSASREYSSELLAKLRIKIHS